MTVTSYFFIEGFICLKLWNKRQCAISAIRTVCHLLTVLKQDIAIMNIGQKLEHLES